MLRVSLILLWVISSSVIEMSAVRPVFGVKVSIAPNSQIKTFVCYNFKGRNLTDKRVLDRETFVKFVSGHWPSIYNPYRKDFFKEHNIDCALINDEITNKKIVGCVPLDSLWKIRFSTYPFQHNLEVGWSNKYHKPSPKQEIYLSNQYGINHIDGDFFLDTNFWKIMQDVSDPIWIANYKSLK